MERRGKQITGGAELRDEATLARVERDLKLGDHIEIEIRVDWDDSRAPTVLVGLRQDLASDGD